MVYVEVRKAASSTIGAALREFFGADNLQCGDAPAECRVLFGRCSSECLTSEQLKGYYFFSFTRDPTQRFYSALKESFVVHNREHKKHPWESLNKTMAMGMLDAMRSTECDVDHHLESQSTALSTRLPAAGGSSFEVRFDFLGRVDRLVDGMAEVLEGAQSKSGNRLPEGKAKKILEFIGRTRENTGQEIKSDIMDEARDPEVDAAVREVYGQDLACFGS